MSGYAKDKESVLNHVIHARFYVQYHTTAETEQNTKCNSVTLAEFNVFLSESLVVLEQLEIYFWLEYVIHEFNILIARYVQKYYSISYCNVLRHGLLTIFLYAVFVW